MHTVIKCIVLAYCPFCWNLIHTTNVYTLHIHCEPIAELSNCRRRTTATTNTFIDYFGHSLPSTWHIFNYIYIWFKLFLLDLTIKQLNRRIRDLGYLWIVWCGYNHFVTTKHRKHQMNKTKTKTKSKQHFAEAIYIIIYMYVYNQEGNCFQLVLWCSYWNIQFVSLLIIDRVLFDFIVCYQCFIWK